MAHPVRRASAEAVQASLDRPTPIVWDPVAKPSKDKMQRWRNGRNAWQTAYDADPAADWCLVLQDDVRVADNLLAGIERSEERRVGKECRSRWSPKHEKKKRWKRGTKHRQRCTCGRIQECYTQTDDQ